MGGQHRCEAGHQITGGQLICPSCRFEQVIEAVEAIETSLPRVRIAAAVRTVVTNSAVLRNLAAALAAGAPPVVGHLVNELIAAGSTVCAPPVCRGCARRGLPLFRGTDGGGEPVIFSV